MGASGMVICAKCYEVTRGGKRHNNLGKACWLLFFVVPGLLVMGGAGGMAFFVALVIAIVSSTAGRSSGCEKCGSGDVVDVHSPRADVIRAELERTRRSG